MACGQWGSPSFRRLVRDPRARPRGPGHERERRVWTERVLGVDPQRSLVRQRVDSRRILVSYPCRIVNGATQKLAGRKGGGGLVGGGASAFKLFSLCWGIGDGQRCDSFRHTAKGLSRTHARIHSPPNSPPIQAATQHWAEFPEL